MRERMKYELSNKEKRWKAMNRLSPETLDIVIDKYIVFKVKKILEKELVKEISKYIKSDKKVYCFDTDDGEYMNLKESIDFALREPFPVIIVCNDNMLL